MSACKVINAAERDDGAKITKRDFENAKKHMRCCFAFLCSINDENSLSLSPCVSVCLSISLSLSFPALISRLYSPLGVWFVSRMLDLHRNSQIHTYVCFHPLQELQSHLDSFPGLRQPLLA